MSRRLDLQTLLEKLIDNKNVYFQPPPSISMNYPAIKYTRHKIDNRFADDLVYSQEQSYQLTVIDRDPDSDIVDKVSMLPRCQFDRHYNMDNLNHDVFILYF